MGQPLARRRIGSGRLDGSTSAPLRREVFPQRLRDEVLAGAPLLDADEPHALPERARDTGCELHERPGGSSQLQSVSARHTTVRRPVVARRGPLT